jgi:hypothetical protein
MKNIVLCAALFILLALSVSTLPAVSQTPAETRVTGTLHLGSINQAGPRPSGTGYWLRLDKPIVFAQGTRSERVVKDVTLTVPAGLQDKARELESQHVVVAGPMDCTMHFTPWTATCDLRVKQIDRAE